MADVFISYHWSAGSSALVRRIAGELKNRGVSCWYYEQNDAPVDFVERIVTQIERCKVFLFIWDEQANEDSKKRNSYVRSEIQCAYGEKHIALFPFQVGDFEKNKTLKFYFGHINIPYGGNTPETTQTKQLVNAIIDILDKTRTPPVITQLPSTEVIRCGMTWCAAKLQLPPTKIIKSGNCGDNVTYTLDENGILTISGNGAMQDFRWDGKTKAYKMPWWNEREIISHIEIQNGVTEIGINAFRGAYRKLASASIPDSIISIRDMAFMGCENLTNVNIPNGVTFIGKFAFYGCENLISISVPAKAKIHPDAFPFYILRVTRRE